MGHTANQPGNLRKLTKITRITKNGGNAIKTSSPTQPFRKVAAFNTSAKTCAISGRTCQFNLCTWNDPQNNNWIQFDYIFCRIFLVHFFQFHPNPSFVSHSHPTAKSSAWVKKGLPQAKKSKQTSRETLRAPSSERSQTAKASELHPKSKAHPCLKNLAIPKHLMFSGVWKNVCGAEELGFFMFDTSGKDC